MEEVVKEVKTLVQKRWAWLEPELLKPNASIRDELDADSLDLVELTLDIEDHFEISIEDDYDYHKLNTLQDLYDLVCLKVVPETIIFRDIPHMSSDELRKLLSTGDKLCLEEIKDVENSRYLIFKEEKTGKRYRLYIES